ncbi:Ethylene-insensitive protein 2 [Morus notabilis]|uniref:Ethylene-insensitive protein 2 n=1 Tax=Morus notabilis TaxID=981085 RepID=W9RX02_9ROSA|nr:ethylene-insensitive protein 2 [Morus notabilis]XP_024028755.1 ethylene-insensitive protein 2 [Morus notabilis]EXC16205.1 Ethylene-insensitive protein 2 [Morus notabilis]
MEAENSNANRLPTVLHRLVPVVVPVLLVAIGYVDPGKWAATVEGGAHFGSDLVALTLVFNFAAILCQYLSARIGVVTGRDLAQICSDEYDKWTCIFLGLQTELSMILLDLTMVLGIAHGLNHLFEWDLFTCVLLTAISAILFPVYSLLEMGKVNFLCIYIAGFILFSSVLGVLINHQEMTLSMNGMLTKLSGESAFALMSLLGASIMPHNFYLHSSIVQQQHGPENVSKDALCHKHFFAILCVFSGIYVVNYVLMNSAANAFYSSGLVLLTFQDAMSVVEQVFRGPIAPVAFLLVLFVSNQITALSWGVGGQVVLRDFLKLDIPGWLHCATIRIIAIIPALYCVWSSGHEGMYQLLIFSQVLVALLLPSSVIPLFRIAASRPIMGAYKVPQIVEFLTLIAFIGMLGLKIVFVVEMVFGNSDWVGNLWNMGSSMSASYVVLLIIVCASFCLMLWLAATPLKSASVPLDAQAWNWDSPKSITDSFTRKDDIDITESRYHGEARVPKQELTPVLGRALDSQSDVTVANFDFELPETLIEPDHELQSTTVEENSSNNAFSSSSTTYKEESASIVEAVPVSTVVNEVSDITLMKNSQLKTDIKHPVEKTVGVESDLQVEKDDDEGDTWEAEDLSKGAPGTPSFSSEGPGSFRSLSGKSDDWGNGAGSLSRLAGLGRAARRQLAAVLDEFWGQLYDFHGQLTQEAKAKRLDVLFGADSKAGASSLKVDTTAKEISGYFPSVGGRGSDPLTNSSLYDSPEQQRVRSNLESSYDVQRGASSLWSNNMQLDAYAQNSNCNVLDAGERRYSSVRNLPTSEAWGDYQPATVHGYQIASYVSRLAKERSSENLNGQLQSQAIKSSTLGATNYRDSLAFAMGQKLQSGLSAAQVSGIQSLIASRNSLMQTERPYYALCPSGPAETVVTSANTKKYHSLPDIHRDIYASDKIPQWESASGFGSSVGRTGYEQSMYSNSGSRTGGPLAFDELSPSKVYRDALSAPMNSSFDTGSLWSRQPFEQFGVADSARSFDSRVGSRMSTVNQEAISPADLEAKLLQSFRHCIVKLLKLEGSDWLFRQNDGADEELIDRVAAREKFLYEAEAREMNRVHMGEPQYLSPERKYSSLKNSDASFAYSAVSSVPHCGEGCVWKSDLIVSFGVWCIHRVLDLSLMESRPELWGKYTYVLNRLQGIIDPAFSKPRSPMTPCFCLHVPAAAQQRLSPPVSNGMLPPAAKPARGKCTTAVTLLDIIKDVEIAISCRKGRMGTAAGDVAFPKGKENLASVLKRYRRRLSNKPVITLDGPGSRKVPSTSAPYVSTLV